MATINALSLPYRKRLRSPEKDGEAPDADASKRRKWSHIHDEGQETQTNEVERYIQQKLRIGIGLDVGRIQAGILEKSAGVILWAALVISILNEEFRRWNIAAVELKLKDLPSELPDLLVYILKLHNDTADRFLLCMQWLLYTKRLLHVNEFYLAITSGLNAPPTPLAWDPQNYTAHYLQKFVSEISHGLAKVSQSQKVVLVHESIRDFLISRGGSRLLWPDIEDFRSHAHNSLKECCSKYMNVQVAGTKLLPSEKAEFESHTISWVRQEAVEELPFLTYAYENVLYHADAAARKIPQGDFLAGFDLQTWIKAHNLLEKDENCHYTSEASILYILVEQNYAELVRIVLESDPRFNFQGERHKYPLFAALAHGHRGIVRELLRQPVSVPEITDIYMRLSYNKNFVSFVAPDDLNPLQWSVQQNLTSLTRLLIACGEFDDKLFDHFDQPLIVRAAMQGHEDIVKMMIETKNIDVNTRDKQGSTPLLQATIHRHEGIAKYLLSRPGIDVNTQDNAKYSPLLWAAINGHESILELLLAVPGIDINISNHTDETPLMWAAQLQHVGLLNRLLAAGNVDVNRQDKSGRTALSRAIEYGRVYAVKVLIAVPGIDTKTRDRLGLSPLFEALRRGNHAIADLIGHII